VLSVGQTVWGEEVVGGSAMGCAAYKCSTAAPLAPLIPSRWSCSVRRRRSGGWPFCEEGHGWVVQKVDQSLELRDERAGATGGRFGNYAAGGSHSIELSFLHCIEEGFNYQNRNPVMRGPESYLRTPLPAVLAEHQPPPPPTRRQHYQTISLITT